MASKGLSSVFTDDMNHCFFTGSPYVERHHIFGASNRKRSENYGFVIPLSPKLHPNGAGATWGNDIADLDLRLKRMAQTYYEAHIGTREGFREEFGKSWL